ncbi:MAG: hypothetical protein WD876_00615 [Candidatus Pacearchaeota archaeon]
MTKKIYIQKEENFESILSWLDKNRSAGEFHYYLNRKPINRNKFIHLFRKANLYEGGSLELKLSENSNLVFEVSASFINGDKNHLRLSHLYIIPPMKSKKDLSLYI